MSKAFGQQNPTFGEIAVSWQTFSDGSAGIPSVTGDSDWGKMTLDLSGEEGRSAVYDLGSSRARTLTLTENRYGSGTETAQLQIRGHNTTTFSQDDVSPAWENYYSPTSRAWRYIQIREITGVITPSHFVDGGAAGDDAHPGTEAEPWKTIQHAVDTVSPGDTVYIRGGTYNENALLYYNSGEADNWITYRNYPGEVVIMDGTGIVPTSGNGLWCMLKSDYVRVCGIQIKNSNSAGINVLYCHYIRLDHLYIYNSTREGIGAWGHIEPEYSCNNIYIDNNEVDYCCVPKYAEDNDTLLYDSGEEFISIVTCDYVWCHHNNSHTCANWAGTPNIHEGEIVNGGEGAGIRDGATWIYFYNNLTYNLRRVGPGVIGWDAADSPIGHDIYIYCNITHHCYHGFITSVERGQSNEDVYIYNNIAYDCSGGGFGLPFWSSTTDGIKHNIQVVNNIFYHNAYGVFCTTSDPYLDGIIIRNNIFAENTAVKDLGTASAGEFTVDHNLFYNNDSTWGTDVVEGNPLFANVGTHDFHIGDGSPAIGAGSLTGAPTHDYDLVLRGAGVDIGAFEHV